MPNNINSAFRIRDVLQTLSKIADKTPMHEVWGEIFGIDEQNRQRKIFAISRCLSDLHDEVEHVRTEMLKLDYSEQLFSGSLNKCNNIFAVQSISTNWSSLKAHLSPEVSITVGFCSEILPNEEELIDPELLSELRAMASELRSLLARSELPIFTISIIEKHLSKIEEALSKYVAVGSKALEDVMQSAYGEVISNEAAFEESKGSQEVGKLSKMWQKTKVVLDGAVDCNKRLGAVGGMAEKGHKVLEFLQGIDV